MYNWILIALFICVCIFAVTCYIDYFVDKKSANNDPPIPADVVEKNKKLVIESLHKSINNHPEIINAIRDVLADELINKTVSDILSEIR
jgi:hypothetical protein